MIYYQDYAVSVMDGNNCNVVLNLSITEPSALFANASATNLTDYGANDGTANTNPTGGTPGYSYQWSTGATTQTITGLAPGAYTVIVTDASGCTKQQTVFVSAYNCALSAIISLSHVRCFGGMDGNVNIEIIGGTASLCLCMEQWRYNTEHPKSDCRRLFSNSL
ncbi:MAG: SprB repeat-containing protein [Lewinellaceae bacterium]|nr:SprB repeat-containing protein [Lewinellaceae bacterium]